MKRVALLMLFVTGAALAQQAPGGGPEGPRNSYADPSAVIAAEGALSRLAREKGQWTAFAAMATPDAVLFRPGMVYAREWLSGQLNPPVPVQRQAQQVWASCDGTLMVSHGAWRQGDAFGSFTTIWQRQADGRYKWVLDQNQATQQPLGQPDMIAAFIADCPDRPRQPAGAPPQGRAEPRPNKVQSLPPLDPSHRSGKSDDGSLSWDVSVDPFGARSLRVSWKKDGADRLAFEGRTPASVR